MGSDVKFVAGLEVSLVDEASSLRLLEVVVGGEGSVVEPVLVMILLEGELEGLLFSDLRVDSVRVGWFPVEDFEWDEVIELSSAVKWLLGMFWSVKESVCVRVGVH